jgi:hypothetical protein
VPRSLHSVPLGARTPIARPTIGLPTAVSLSIGLSRIATWASRMPHGRLPQSQLPRRVSAALDVSVSVALRTRRLRVRARRRCELMLPHPIAGASECCLRAGLERSLPGRWVLGPGRWVRGCRSVRGRCRLRGCRRMPGRRWTSGRWRRRLGLGLGGCALPRRCWLRVRRWILGGHWLAGRWWLLGRGCGRPHRCCWLGRRRCLLGGGWLPGCRWILGGRSISGRRWPLGGHWLPGRWPPLGLGCGRPHRCWLGRRPCLLGGGWLPGCRWVLGCRSISGRRPALNPPCAFRVCRKWLACPAIHASIRPGSRVRQAC